MVEEFLCKTHSEASERLHPRGQRTTLATKKGKRTHGKPKDMEESKVYPREFAEAIGNLALHLGKVSIGEDPAQPKKKFHKFRRLENSEDSVRIDLELLH